MGYANSVRDKVTYSPGDDIEYLQSYAGSPQGGKVALEKLLKNGKALMPP